MGTALVKIKIMPTSPEVDLDVIREVAKDIVGKNKGTGTYFEEQPIAFGLKAVIVGFAIDENDELEPIEKALREMEDVSSAEVSDMRRAFG